MNIQTRQAHLIEMGVHQWHPRFKLVGAAKSPVINKQSFKSLESSEKAEDLLVSSSLEKIENTPVTSLIVNDNVEPLIGEVSHPLKNGLSSVVSTLAEGSVLTPVSSIAESSGLPQITGGPIPNLSLGAFISGNYLVVSEVGGGVPYLDEISLLQNILRVVDSKCLNLAFQGGFNWPVFKSAKVLLGHELLHEDLILRWLSSFDLNENRVLMSFGGQSNKVIEDISNNSALQLGGAKVVFFNDSLADLYKTPFRKKDVWKVLVENSDIFNKSSES
jgi:hypothetical protein